MSVSFNNVQALFTLLQNALSQDEALRKPAEAALTACETRPGFCSCLAEIIALQGQGTIRWLACVYFKNSINKYWRQRRDAFGINSAEKAYLRSKLLELIREEDNQVAVQLALLISKIARYDYAKEWADLFPNLIQKIQSSDVLTIQRAYMVLNQVLKELSTKRLTVDQKNFAQITSQLFDYTWHSWFGDTQRLLNDFSTVLAAVDGGLFPSESKQLLELTCERWMFCLKSLCRMLKFGFPSDSKSLQEVAPVKEVCPQFLQVVKSLLPYCSSSSQGHFLQDFLMKACLKLMKTLVEVQSVHPYSFSDRSVLAPVLEFCYRAITEPQGYDDSFEQFLIQCMILIQTLLQCKEYRHTQTGRVVGQMIISMEEAKKTLAIQAEGVVKSLLNNERILVLCDILVRRYFMLTANDLDEWSRDSELFYHDQDMVQWKDKLRPCAESLYLTLFENYREILAPLVMQILKQTSDDCPPASPSTDVELNQRLLLKEAAYNAVGVASYDLYDIIDFKSWFEGTLAQELQNTHPNNRILRRRVAWLLGQWVSKIRRETRRPVYYSLLGLLGDVDMAVQLAACRSLQYLIDDVHFYEEEFVEFVPMCLELLFRFMQNAQEFDSKLQAFNLVSLIIDRIGEKVVPCTKSIIMFLPQVWHESEDQSLLRIQVIVALQRLVVALGPQSPVCYDLLFPILDHCTDVSQPDELNMLEDGLQLWHVSLKHSPAMVPQLMSLFPHLVAIMERNLDHLQVAMKIIESYILLGQISFLRTHASGVVKILETCVGNTNEKGMLSTLAVIDILIQCAPGDAPLLLEGILKKLLVLVICGSDEPDIVKAYAGAVLARVLLQNNSFFAHLTSQTSALPPLQQLGAATSENILLLFFDAWLDKIDSLTTIQMKKICALAVCILLTMREQQILDRLEQLLSICTSVLNESEDDHIRSASTFHQLTSTVNINGTSDSAECEDTRKRQTLTTDPVNKMALGPLLREKLQACAALHGEAAFNAALSKLHPSLLQQLQHLLHV